MAKVSAPKIDKEWESQCDAETLANAAAIKADRPRFTRAQKAAKRMADEQQTKASALKRIARAPKRKGKS